MLKYSLSTVYMTILTSNLLLILIALFFRSSKVMINLGYRLLAIFVSITFIRFLFPFELPFTNRILLPNSLSFIIVLFRYPFLSLGKFQISLWILLETIWMIGIIIGFVRHVKELRATKRFIYLFGKSPKHLNSYSLLLEEICITQKKKNKFRILEIENLDSPKLYGIRKPIILLPSNLDLPIEDMHYILTHEATHHFHHDILLKYFVHILSIIYWWNPACSFLYKKTSLILEMRIDDSVVSTPAETSHYLRCLLYLAETAQTKNHFNNALSLPLAPLHKGELTKRFEMLTSREQPRNFWVNISTLFIIGFLYILSYFYIFEAHYITPEIEETITLYDDTSYFIQNENGTYDLYHTGIYFETVTDLDYFPDDIPIYTREEYKSVNSP